MPQALGRTGREDYTPRPMPAAGSLKRLVMRLQLSGALPNQDYVLNHVVNRMPFVDPRMRAYAALGVQFDDLDSANISLGWRCGPGTTCRWGVEARSPSAAT